MEDFVTLVYPKICLSCRDSLVKGEDVICTKCILDLPLTNFHKDPENPLAIRFKGRLQLIHALAFLWFRKKGKVQSLLHSLKYKGNKEVGLKLGKVYGHELYQSGLVSQYDIIVSVPLHNSRLRQRGYNQSDEWARGLSYSTKINFELDVLARGYKTETQTRKTKLSRWENVKEIFYVKAPQLVAGKTVLLVDDVVTTGATLESCCNTLFESGCKGVGIACIAFAE